MCTEEACSLEVGAFLCLCVPLPAACSQAILCVRENNDVVGPMVHCYGQGVMM